MLGILVALLLAVLPTCAEESDTNCQWDAQQNGNGLGSSFVTVADHYIYTD
jgi:hypothetical protein